VHLDVAPQREEDHRPATDQEQRVEIGVTAPPAPMQAGNGQAVGTGQLEGADRLAPSQHVAHPHRRSHRLVRRTGRAVVDDHDPAPGEAARERDAPGEGGVHHLAECAGKVDTSVSRAPRGVGWVERSHDARLGLQWPHPDRNRVHGGTDRVCGPREGVERDHDGHGHDEWHPAVDPDRVGE